MSSLRRLLRISSLIIASQASAESPMQKISPPTAGHLYHGFFFDEPAAGSHDSNEHNVTPQDVQRYEKAMGKKAAWVYFSQQFFEGTEFPAATCQWIRDLGKVPYVRLMTWSQAEQNKAEKVYTLEAIIDGKFDEVFRKWGTAAKKFNAPLLVEWGVECNGSWFPWNGFWNGGAKKNGFGNPTRADGPERFVAAYRRIISLMRESGAENITWVWHVDPHDEPEAPWNALENYYPGDDFIDWIAVSTYGAQSPSEKTDLSTFREQLDPVYKRLTKLAPEKPIMVAEFGCALHNQHQNAARWADAALNDLLKNRWPRVIGFCWWNERWENDGHRAHDTDMIIMHDRELTSVFRERMTKAGDQIVETILSPEPSVIDPRRSKTRLR